VAVSSFELFIRYQHSDRESSASQLDPRRRVWRDVSVLVALEIEVHRLKSGLG